MRHAYFNHQEYNNGSGSGCGKSDGRGTSVGITNDFTYDGQGGIGKGSNAGEMETRMGTTHSCKGDNGNSGNGGNKGESYGTGISAKSQLKPKILTKAINSPDCKYNTLLTCGLVLIILSAIIGLLHLNGFFERIFLP